MMSRFANMNEIWKPIKSFEGLYEVSNLGNVKSLERVIIKGGKPCNKKERLLKLTPNSRGYITVVLCKEGKTYPKTVHRLVAETFIPNPLNKPNVDHIDTDTTNNKVGNLHWVTVQENCMNPITRVHNSESKKGHRGYLKHHTEETKKKLSAMMKGAVFSEEHRKKLSEAKKHYYSRKEQKLCV